MAVWFGLYYTKCYLCALSRDIFLECLSASPGFVGIVWSLIVEELCYGCYGCLWSVWVVFF